MCQSYFAFWKRPFDFKNIGFLVLLFVFAIPSRATLVQLSCKENRSYLIEQKEKIDVEGLLISPAIFLEKDPSKVWKVSYNLQNGNASINESKKSYLDLYEFKVIGDSNYEYGKPVLIYSKSENFSKSRERINEGFLFKTDKLKVTSNMTTISNYLTIDNHGSGYSRFTFVNVINENKEHKVINLEDPEEVEFNVDEQLTREISSGICSPLKSN